MNSIGQLLRLTTFGESHGKAMGGILDGMPPGFNIDFDKVQAFIDRRRPGTSENVTARKESDIPQFLSGISSDGITLGTPIGFMIPNSDTRSGDYDENAGKYRPSHADFTYQAKYGIREHRGGGRASARETVSWVTAAALAEQWLEQLEIKFHAQLTAAGDVAIDDPFRFLREGKSSGIYAPEDKIQAIMDQILMAKRSGDSVGGRVSCVITGMPPGIGDPVFDKLHSSLAAAMMSINAAKAFEYGLGIESASARGKEVADLFTALGPRGEAVTQTNYSGGIQGGISNGMPIYFNVWFKPTPTVAGDYPTLDTSGNNAVIRNKGRHDPCVALRAVPIVEALAILVTGDALLRRNAYLFC